MTDFRNERVGLINACRILRVPAAYAAGWIIIGCLVSIEKNEAPA